MSLYMLTGLVLFVSFALFQVYYIVYPLIKMKGKKRIYRGANQVRMSILIPAYNEEAVVESCLAGMLALDYDNYEAVFVNDGSTDNTLPKLLNLLEAEPIKPLSKNRLTYQPVRAVYRSTKYPNMIIVDKMNGGKADSLNAAIDYASGDVVITLDADSILDEDSLNAINTKFHDERVIGAGGLVQVGQMFNQEGKINFKGKGLVKYQLSDYLSSFFVRKSTHSSINVLAIVSGAFGAFRRSVLFEIGGYKRSLGEDMEITMNLQRYIKKTDKKLIFIPEAICYTEVPENFKDSLKQKNRWQKGFIDCVVKYRKAFFGGFTAKFSVFLIWDSLMLGITGVISLVSLPFIFILHYFSTEFLVLYITSNTLKIASRFIAYYVASRYGFKLTKIGYLKLFFFTLLETFTYRLLDEVIFAYGTLSYFLSRDKHNWNKVKRLGNVVVHEKLSA